MDSLEVSNYTLQVTKIKTKQISINSIKSKENSMNLISNPMPLDCY